MRVQRSPGLLRGGPRERAYGETDFVAFPVHDERFLTLDGMPGQGAVREADAAALLNDAHDLY